MKIAVVGHCASGKSTVVRLLQQRGYSAYSVAQEHSVIRDLWNHQRPNHVVFLDVSLDEIRRRRRNPHWPEWIYVEQEQRLQDAREHSSVVVDTDSYDPDAIADLVQESLAV